MDSTMHACHDLCEPYKLFYALIMAVVQYSGHASKHGAAQHTGRDSANIRAEEETSRLKQQ